MSRDKLERLYRLLGDFQADLTFEEYLDIKDAMDTVKTSIHKRIQEI